VTKISLFLNISFTKRDGAKLLILPQKGSSHVKICNLLDFWWVRAMVYGSLTDSFQKTSKK
jgi:hypothetical protein